MIASSCFPPARLSYHTYAETCLQCYLRPQDIQNAIAIWECNQNYCTSCHWTSKFVTVIIFHTSASGIPKRSCFELLGTRRNFWLPFGTPQHQKKLWLRSELKGRVEIQSIGSAEWTSGDPKQINVS